MVRSSSRTKTVTEKADMIVIGVQDKTTDEERIHAARIQLCGTLVQGLVLILMGVGKLVTEHSLITGLDLTVSRILIGRAELLIVTEGILVAIVGILVVTIRMVLTVTLALALTAGIPIVTTGI